MAFIARTFHQIGVLFGIFAATYAGTARHLFAGPVPTRQPTAAPTKRCSALTCVDLGLEVGAASKDVCATSYAAGDGDGTCLGGGEGDDGAVTHAAAAALCEDTGARLCTRDELAAGEAAMTGCGRDARWVWSATPCESGQDDTYWAVEGRGGAGAAEACTAASTELLGGKRWFWPK